MKIFPHGASEGFFGCLRLMFGSRVCLPLMVRTILRNRSGHGTGAAFFRSTSRLASRRAVYPVAFPCYSATGVFPLSRCKTIWRSRPGQGTGTALIAREEGCQ